MRQLSIPAKRPAFRLWGGAVLLLLAGLPAARGQATQDQNTTPSPPSLSQPAPASSRPDATANHPAPPSVYAPPTGNQPGALKEGGKGTAGVVVLPYADKPVGTPTIAAPPAGAAQLGAEASQDGTRPLLLDRVVALINGDVILESDVQEERHFAAFEPYAVAGGRFTPIQAMQRIVRRTLILQQMRDQQVTTPPTDAEVAAQIADLRRQIPACAQYRCESEAGWRTFLAANGFTEQELAERWKQRMTILQFIGIRFRNGIRIPKPEIEDYYRKNMVPQFAQRHIQPPPLAKVQTRIEEVLLQQRVNVLLNDWLKSLRDAGNTSILDPAYADAAGTAGNNSQDDDDTAGGSR